VARGEFGEIARGDITGLDCSSLFQRYSPEGATVLLCLIGYVIRRVAGCAVRDEVFVGVSWG